MKCTKTRVRMVFSARRSMSCHSDQSNQELMFAGNAIEADSRTAFAPFRILVRLFSLFIRVPDVPVTNGNTG